MKEPKKKEAFTSIAIHSNSITEELWNKIDSYRADNNGMQKSRWIAKAIIFYAKKCKII